MSLLINTQSYLAGAMNFADDDGIGWRQEFKKLANESRLPTVFFDPTDKPEGLGDNVGDEKAYAKKLRKVGDWDALTEHVKAFRRIDLRAVDKSDYLVVSVDPTVHMFGTIHEIVLAANQSKPIFAITCGGKEKASDWLFSLVRHEEMFDNVNDLVDHLVKIDTGQVPMDDRWALVKKV